MGLTFADAASLVAKGYKVAELKEVGLVIDQNPEEGNNIVELAKKLGFAEFKNAMQLFAKADSKDADQHTPNDNETDQNDADDQTDEKGKDSSADDQGREDGVDYKQMYEKEKALRIKLQQSKQGEDTSGKEDQKSDYEVALDLAADVLN